MSPEVMQTTGMKRPLLCLLAVTLPLCAENLFENSDMDTAGGWKGNRKIVKDEKPSEEKDAKPNRLLVVAAKLREPVSFSQEVVSKDIPDLVLKFRYRTKDYVGRGYQIRGVRQGGGSTFVDKKFIADGQWHEVVWAYTQVQGSKKINFQFSVLEGTGDVCFDDIVMEAAKN